LGREGGWFEGGLSHSLHLVCLGLGMGWNRPSFKLNKMGWKGARLGLNRPGRFAQRQGRFGGGCCGALYAFLFGEGMVWKGVRPGLRVGVSLLDWCNRGLGRECGALNRFWF
jgi:hypothetical protein